MTDQPTPRKPVFIEKIFPVKLLNQQVYYEHGGNPFKGLHRWYSRKPLSFSRASVLGSILPEGVTIEEFEYLLGLNRRVGGMQDTTTKLYKTPPSADRIAKVHDLCEGLWGTRTPTVLDAFAGGGSIPFEAARYGLNVLASDLNPVAVVTMKAAIEYPLKFGPDLQVDIDKWVKWVGDEAKVRLAEFFPSQAGETVVNYLWAHTVVCPSCESVVPLSPNWWLSKTSNYAGKGEARKITSDWYAVRPVPNRAEKRVDFELVRGKKGKGDTIQYSAINQSLIQSPIQPTVVQASCLLSNKSVKSVGNANGNSNVGGVDNRQDACTTSAGDGRLLEYDPGDEITISRAVGKCPNCTSIIENNIIMQAAKVGSLNHHVYAVAFKQGKGSLEFRIPTESDLEGILKSEGEIRERLSKAHGFQTIPIEEIPEGKDFDEQIRTFCPTWKDMFNPRQLLTLVTYAEIINEAKLKLQQEHEPEKVEAIVTYLTLVLDRCVDHNSRSSGWHSSRASVDRASKTHALNLIWNYPEVAGTGELWYWCADAFVSDYANLCNLIGSKPSSDSLASIIPINQASVVQASCLLSSSSPTTQQPNPTTFSKLSVIETGRMPVPQGDGESLSGDLGIEQYLEFPEIRNSKLKISYRGDLPHWELEGAVYFITFNTWEKLGLTPAAQQVVLDACLFFNQQRYKIYSLVIMPDHVHILIQPLEKSEGEYWTLASILHSIKSYSSKQIPKVMPHIGIIWQDSRYDRVIRDDREFHHTWEYIRQNPVKAKLSNTPENYPFLWQIQSSTDQSQIQSQSTVVQASCLLSSPDQSTEIIDPLGLVNQSRSTGRMPVPQGTEELEQQGIKIISASADNLSHIPNKSLHAVVTDPPYYATIQYSELSDFFYVWQKRTLGDIFPELYWSDLTDKDREAVANPSRFRNMGISPEELANQDYEAKMALAFAEYHRVLRDDGVMTVQFNHKDSGAWDTLAKSLIDSGFEITASWAVSTENPQNLHQAQKNSVSSTVLLVCRKRDPNAGQAWWADLRPLVTHLVETRAPEFEANDIDGIDLYLSAFGPALNIFSRNYPILDTSGHEVRPEQAFAEARKAIANYRFHKLAQTDTAGFDPITTWYILAWDAFRAREFPFDEARQLALAVGGFNLMDLHKIHKIAEIKGGNCKLLTPDQRLKKRAFSTNPDDFTLTTLIDALHATLAKPPGTGIAIYLEEGSFAGGGASPIDPVRRFLKGTDLLSNDRFMRAWEITLRAIPHTRDTKKRIPEEQALADLWLAMDEIKAKVRYVQPELELVEGQCSLF